MALESYGVLIAKCVDFKREDHDGDSPHCQLTLEGGGNTWRAAVNVKSQAKPSELVFHHAANFVHPITDKVKGLPQGFNRLVSNPQGSGLDYIRGNLFPLTDVIALPPTAAGENNDLSDLVEGIARRAIADPDAVLYILGSHFQTASTTFT